MGCLDGSRRALPQYRHNRRLFLRVLWKAIGQEFHVGRGKISLAFTIHNLTAALFIPLAGRLVDRYGARRVLLPFTALLGLILVSSLLLSQAIWQLYVFYVALGVVSGGAGAMPYADVVSHWFDRDAGLAISVMMLGMGLGAIAVPPVAQRLVATLGWRLAYTIFGCSIMVIPLPVVAAFLKGMTRKYWPPAGWGWRSSRLHANRRERCRASSARGRPHARILDRGVQPLSSDCERARLFHSLTCDPDRPGQLVSAGGVRQLALRRWAVHGARRLWCHYWDLVFRPSCRSVAFLRGRDRDCISRLGPRNLVCVHRRRAGRSRHRGRGRHIIAYLTSRYFGLRSYGAIFGWIWAVFNVSGGLGAYLMGFGFDETGSYAVAAHRIFLRVAPGNAVDCEFGTVPISGRTRLNKVWKTRPLEWARVSEGRLCYKHRRPHHPCSCWP